MRNFNEEDLKWIVKCKTYPNLYKIYVDNDDIFVASTLDDDNEAIYTFQNFGYDFIVQVLNYIGCDAEWV